MTDKAPIGKVPVWLVAVYDWTQAGPKHCTVRAICTTEALARDYQRACLQEARERDMPVRVAVSRSALDHLFGDGFKLW